MSWPAEKPPVQDERIVRSPSPAPPRQRIAKRVVRLVVALIVGVIGGCALFLLQSL